MGKVSVVSHGSVIAKATGFTEQCGYDFNLNPAIGCRFGCSYCYAANFTQDKAPSGHEWGEWTILKSHAAQAISKHSPLSGKAIYMSTATDPYQPAERKQGITRGILEVLLEKKHQGCRLVIQTRSPDVVRDIDLIQAIHQHGLCQVNLTISTDCDEIRKAFEPTCPSIEQRLDAARTLCDAGIQTAVTVTPILPLRDIPGFAQQLHALHLQSVVLQPFHSVREMSGVRSTRADALKVMQEMGLTIRHLKDQGNQLYLELRKLGVNIGINRPGFNVPQKM